MDQPLDQLRRPFKKKNLRSISLLGKKQSRVIKKSERESILSKLVKKRIAEGAMGDELQNLGLKGTEDEINYFDALYRSKVDIRSWGFSKNLLTKPLKLYFMDDNVSHPFITSDMLYWSYLSLNSLTGTNAIFKDFITLSKVHMCSKKAIILESKEEISEFYYEDMDKDVFCPMYKPTFDFAHNVANGKTFIINGKTYYVSSNEEQGVPIMISIQGKQADQIKSIVENAVKLKDKKELSIGIKTLSKLEGAYYFQHTITVTNFCPNVMLLKEGKNGKWDFKTLYEFEIIPDLLLESLKKNFNNAMLIISKITTWENVDAMYEIIGVTLLTNLDGNAAIREELTKIWENYKKFKQSIGIYKKLYMLFKRLVLFFLDSFNSRIGIDRMDSVRKLATEFVENYNLIARNETEKENVREFVNLFNDENTMKNFLAPDIIVNAKTIKNTCEKILNPLPGEENELEVNVRALGLRLQDYLYGTKDSIITEIRAPNAFLANTIGEYSVDYLTNLLKTISDKLLREQWKMDENWAEQANTAEAAKQAVLEIIESEGLDKMIYNRIKSKIDDLSVMKMIDTNARQAQVQDKNELRKSLRDNKYVPKREFGKTNNNKENISNKMDIIET